MKPFLLFFPLFWFRKKLDFGLSSTPEESSQITHWLISNQLVRWLTNALGEFAHNNWLIKKQNFGQTLTKKFKLNTRNWANERALNVSDHLYMPIYSVWNVTKLINPCIVCNYMAHDAYEKLACQLFSLQVKFHKLRSGVKWLKQC